MNIEHNSANTNLLCGILQVEQGLRGAFQEEAQLVLLGGGFPLPLGRGGSVEHLGENPGAGCQARPMKRLKTITYSPYKNIIFRVINVFIKYSLYIYS